MSCTRHNLEPAPGFHLDPQPGRHTLITPDGDTESMCSWCLIDLIFATEKWGSRVTMSIAPALADAAVA